MTPILQTVAAPEPGIFGAGTLGTSLLRAALVVTHGSNSELNVAVNPDEGGDSDGGAGTDNAADGADEMRWANGLEFQPYTCADALVLDPCATVGYNAADDDSNRPAVRPYLPFVVDAHDTCSTFGWQAADYEKRARRMMAARESKAVGHEFWNGTIIAANPHLADDGTASGFPATIPAAGTRSPRSGIALLVQAIADGNGGAGMVHMRPRLFQYGASVGLFRYEGGKWYTHAGQVVVADAGYTGIGPAGQAVADASGAITEWAYATDLVEVHRGPVDVFAPSLKSPSVAHQSNTEVVRATRMYAPIFNGCVLAAVSITTPIADE